MRRTPARRRALIDDDRPLATPEQIAKLEAAIEAGGAGEVRKAARELAYQLRLRTWLHRKLLSAVRSLDEQDAAARTRSANAPMEGP